MSNITPEIIRSIIESALDERSRLDHEIHAKHHDWIQERIDTEKARKKFYNEGIKTFIQWSILGLLGSIVYWIQQHVRF